MEKVTLARSGQSPLRFEGELLAESDGERLAGAERNRWHELAVYRTQGGGFAVRIAYHSRWQGELESDFAAAASSPVAVELAFREYDPTAAVNGYPDDAIYAERQAKLLADIRQRYQYQVGEILTKLPDLDSGAPAGALEIVAEPSPEGGYTLHIPSMPGCVSEGDNLADGLRNLAEAAELWQGPEEDSP